MRSQMGTKHNFEGVKRTHNLIKLHTDNIRGAADAKDENFVDSVENKRVHVLLPRQAL